MKDNASGKELALFLAIFTVFISYVLALLVFGSFLPFLLTLLIAFIVALLAARSNPGRNSFRETALVPTALLLIFVISAFQFLFESIPHLTGGSISCEAASTRFFFFTCIMKGLIDCGIALFWPVLAVVSLCALYLYSLMRRNQT